MDKRLIFRYWVWKDIDGVTELDRLSIYMVGCLSHESVPVGKSAGMLCRRVMGDPAFGGGVNCVKLPRKPSKIIQIHPYRKPTPVDRMRIPRRSREPFLGN